MLVQLELRVLMEVQVKQEEEGLQELQENQVDKDHVDRGEQLEQLAAQVCVNN